MVKRATEGILLDGTAMVAISARAATTVSAEAAWSELQHAVGGAACGANVEDDGIVELLVGFALWVVINKVRTKEMLRAEVNNRSWPVYVKRCAD